MWWVVTPDVGGIIVELCIVRCYSVPVHPTPPPTRSFVTWHASLIMCQSNIRQEEKDGKMENDNVYQSRHHLSSCHLILSYPIGKRHGDTFLSLQT